MHMCACASFGDDFSIHESFPCDFHFNFNIFGAKQNQILPWVEIYKSHLLIRLFLIASGY